MLSGISLMWTVIFATTTVFHAEFIGDHADNIDFIVSFVPNFYLNQLQPPIKHFNKVVRKISIFFLNIFRNAVRDVRYFVVAAKIAATRQEQFFLFLSKHDEHHLKLNGPLVLDGIRTVVNGRTCGLAR